MKIPFISPKPVPTDVPDPSALLDENRRLRAENQSLRRALEESEKMLLLARETTRRMAGGKPSGDATVAAALREAVRTLSKESRDGGEAFRYALESRLEATEYTDRLQGEILSRLADASEAIATARQSLADILGAWQRDIYLHDLTPLCYCLQQLERMTAAAQDDGEKARLEGLLRAFDDALRRIGVSAFSPDAGETFDPSRHIAAEGTRGGFVTGTVVRGYVKTNDTAGSLDVLSPAEVTLTDVPPLAK